MVVGWGDSSTVLHGFSVPRQAWSLPGPTPGLFLPETLPNSCYVFISLVGGNQLPIKINRENISQTLKHALPLIYVLKINLGGQPVKSVNCCFGHKSMKSLQRAPRSRRPAWRDGRNVCLQPGSRGRRALGSAGAAGSLTAWPRRWELPGLGLSLSGPIPLACKRGTVKHLFLHF